MVVTVEMVDAMCQTGTGDLECFAAQLAHLKPANVTKVLPPNSLAKLLAQQDPIGDILRRSPLREFTEALQRQEDMLLRNLRQPAFDALTRSARWPDIAATLHATRRANQMTEVLVDRRLDDSVLREARGAIAATDVFASYRTLDQEFKRVVLTTKHAMRPTNELVRTTTERTLATLQPTRLVADAIKNQQTALSQITELTMPWALKDHPALSIAGFVRIVRLRDLAADDAPYGPAASEVYEEELGEPVPFDGDATEEDREADAIEAGTNPEVIAFPQPAFPQVLVVAGFKFELPPLGATVSAGGDRSGVFDTQHHLLLNYVEHHLRTLIEAELYQIAGHAWMRRRVPETLRKKWLDRRQQDHDRRGDSYPPIYYADLGHLSDVICQKNNWEEGFHRVFKHKDELQVGIRRLTPIRNALAHARPLTRADQLFLSCEAYRLLRALGVVS